MMGQVCGTLTFEASVHRMFFGLWLAVLRGGSGVSSIWFQNASWSWSKDVASSFFVLFLQVIGLVEEA